MRGIIIWELPAHERARLLGIIPPNYPDVIAHHITHQHGGRDTDPLPSETSGMVIGVADDGVSLQALVVDIGHPRPDGETYYHITWSLDRAQGRAPKHSIELVRNGFERIHPIRIDIVPGFMPLGGKR